MTDAYKQSIERAAVEAFRAGNLAEAERLHGLLEDDDEPVETPQQVSERLRLDAQRAAGARLAATNAAIYARFAASRRRIP